MDNKAYLDQIAVKGKVKTGPVITPTLIKLIAAGAITLITLIIVGAVISGSNAKITQAYERVYLRIANLSGEESPLKTYTERINDSDIRAHSIALLSSLKNTNASISGVVDSIGVKPDKISKTVTDEESTILSDLDYSLETAELAGTLDDIYATKAYQHINLLLAIEAEARAKTPNQQFADILDQSTADLEKLQVQFKKFTKKSE
jgi:hypothetical protein